MLISYQMSQQVLFKLLKLRKKNRQIERRSSLARMQTNFHEFSEFSLFLKL